MNADLIVLPLDEVRAAAETLASGLGRGEVFMPEVWDRAVSILARCHDQVGGDTRRLLYAIFAAVAVDLRTCDLVQQLLSLVAILTPG